MLMNLSIRKNMLSSWGRILKDLLLWENTSKVAKISGLRVRNLVPFPVLSLKSE